MANYGTLVQAIGPVIDVRFKEDTIPPLLVALKVKLDNGKELTLEVVEHVGDEHIIDLLTDMDLKRILLQYFPVGNPFGQRVGIGDDDKRFVRTLQKTQRLGSQDLVSRVDVPVLDGPSIGGGEKVDPVTIGQLVQVVIKITRLLLVVQQAKKSAAAFGE